MVQVLLFTITFMLCHGVTMRPINDEGQTVEGGHRWELENGHLKEYDTDSYPYCFSVFCSECYHMACIGGCDGKDWDKELCKQSQWKPFLPLELNV
jgi:hypothetical protein